MLSPLGSFTAYMKATWEPNYRQELVRGSPFIERVGFSDGPLEVRGNAGLDWSSGPWSAGLNAQFYSRYKITNAYIETINNPLLLSYNGKARIPAQVYVDLSGRYRFDGTGFVPRGTEIRVGIVNLLDHRPPTIADLYSSGASYYGDPPPPTGRVDAFRTIRKRVKVPGVAFGGGCVLSVEALSPGSLPRSHIQPCANTKWTAPTCRCIVLRWHGRAVLCA